jgi:hypothetical protein
LLLCISTGERLWRFRNSGISQMKDAERRDKVSVRIGKDTRPRKGPLKHFEKLAILKTTPLTCDPKAT